MAKTRTVARCGDCGHTEPRWVGRCPACDAWGSMTEEVEARSGGGGARRSGRSPGAPQRPATPIAQVPLGASPRLSTGIGELDRVLGGGLVPGSVTLVGGEPGAGKSTLALQAAHELAEVGRTVLYVSAEESPAQVRLRAERLAALSERLLLASETDVTEVSALVDLHAPDVLVVDSVQTVRSGDATGIPGSVSQVRECAGALVELAKARGMATILIGHVTKDGQLAGPRVLEHLVDTVCDVSGDRHHALRLLRATKNRFGPAGEVGCFEMTSAGMQGVADAGRLFVGDAAGATSGVAITLALEGQRALACEVQALAASTTAPNPRRVASGLDGQRLALLVAVLEKRAQVGLRDHDVYASTVGGVRLTEPSVDLALCLALGSSRLDVPVSAGLVALGEVGLAGEVRLVSQTERRLAEAARLGFSGALLSHAYDGDAHGLRLHRVRDVRAALAAALGT